MRLTPIRCDICGELLYLEESTVYKLKLEGLSNWVKDDKFEFDLCFKCKEELLRWINEMQEKAEE